MAGHHHYSWYAIQITAAVTSRIQLHLPCFICFNVTYNYAAIDVEGYVVSKATSFIEEGSGHIATIELLRNAIIDHCS